MFSGIIEELGEVRNISGSGRVTLLEIEAAKVLEDTGVGDSISVNGVCLTVIKKTADTLSFEVMPETLKLTNLGQLRITDKVNLERALVVGGRVGGHFVLGHVDCLGIVNRKSYRQNNLCFEIAVPPKFISYILPKGSIAVDGISLTVAERKSNTFSVYIIAHTLKNTALGLKGPSSKVNLEFDILAKKSAFVS